MSIIGTDGPVVGEAADSVRTHPDDEGHPGHERVDVVIVGGGPTGLLTACELALGGVRRTVVLEGLPSPAVLPKANGLVGRVVQALDRRGLHERFGGGPNPPAPAPSFPFAGMPLDMAGWQENALYVLPVPQRRMEEVLAERARELGVEIRRGHRLTTLDQDADRVTADVTGPDGPYRITARYLVGADGGHSTVRKRCRIDFPGITDDRFVALSGQVAVHPPAAVPGTGELDVPGLGRLAPASFTRTENGVFAYGMFQPGVYRISVSEWDRPPVEDRAEGVPLDELRAAVGRVLGADLPIGPPPEGAAALHIRSVVGVNSRVAQRYREGRVLLVGDAAHVQSGIGGPGLNLGLQDALNLGWKLAARLTGRVPDALLDSYESERRPVAERVAMQSRAQMALLAPGPGVTALRALFAELLHQPVTVRHLSDLMSGADTRYAMPQTAPGAPAHPLVGAWMPELALRTPAGPTRVAELLRPARTVLLDLAGRPDLVEAASPWSDRLDTVVARPADPEAPAPAPADAVLIRPDGYAAWAVGPGATDPDEAAAGLRAALRTWLGPADRTRPEFADRRYSDRWPGTSSSSAFDTRQSDVP